PGVDRNAAGSHRCGIGNPHHSAFSLRRVALRSVLLQHWSRATDRRLDRRVRCADAACDSDRSCDCGPRRMTSRGRALIICACAGAGLAARMMVPSNAAGGSWVVVATDSTYTISIDTARIRYRPGGVYVVWSRTDHAVPRFYHGKRFNREIVES